MSYTYQAYEDGAGGLHLFALAEDGAPVWGDYYYGEGCADTYSGEERAAADWGGLVVQCIDPVREGWAGLGYWPHDGADMSAMLADYHECEDTARLIADSDDMGRLALGIDLDACGDAGRIFAVAAGAAYECPECGEVVPAVRRVHYPDRWTAPDACPCCGADLD